MIEIIKKWLALQNLPDLENVTDIYINKPYEIILRHEDGSEKYVEDASLSLTKLEELGRHLAAHYNEKFTNFIEITCYEWRFRGEFLGKEIYLTFRRQPSPLTLEAFFTEVECEKVRDAINNHVSILVIGETGSGKTTLCNALVQEIPAEESVVVIESPNELTINHRHMFRVEDKYGCTAHIPKIEIEQAIKKFKASRLVIGELLFWNLDLFMAWLIQPKKKRSVIATLHANSAADTPNRILQCVNSAAGNILHSLEDVRTHLAAVGLIIETEVKLVEGKLERQKPRLVWVKK